MPDNQQPVSQIVDFVGYIDRLKSVTRMNGLHDSSRQENTAEHSWHAALSAHLLAPYANFPVDEDQVVKMLLIHDLIEIEAGDSFVYDPEEMAAQETAEVQAAQVVFQRLPQHQAVTLKSLWEEFEARRTPEAKFAKAIDRFLPIYSNLMNGGFSWKPHQISQSQVREQTETIKEGSIQLWLWIDQALTNAVEAGYLQP